jgi:hypothetical protein
MRNIDREHLNLLSIFHYVLGGLIIVSIVILIVFLFYTTRSLNLEFILFEFRTSLITRTWFFIYLIVFTYSICLIASGQLLAKRKGYWFSFVIACIGCLFVPWGTILGIFTIPILLKDSVKTLYGLN